MTIFGIACYPISGTTISICLPRLHLWKRRINIVVNRSSSLFNKFLPQLQQSRALVRKATMLRGSIWSSLRMWDEEQKRGKEKWQKWIHFPYAEHEEKVDGKLRGKWYELINWWNEWIFIHAQECRFLVYLIFSFLFYVVWIKLDFNSRAVINRLIWNHLILRDIGIDLNFFPYTVVKVFTCFLLVLWCQIVELKKNIY